MKFKKPKFWDLHTPNFLSYLMQPLTLPIRISNFFLNQKKNKKNHKTKTICIGNIYLGGTGKTPTTIKLYKIFKKLGLNVSTAKKFYTSHFDEINILKNNSKLIVEKSRKKIIDIAENKNLDLIIFDDGLQDKTISYNVQLVCFDTESWIGNGCLIPSGPLRETLNSLKKYDAVFIKNSDNNLEEKISILKKYNSSIKVFITYYKPTNLNDFDLSKKYIIFSGIGNPQNFNKLLQKNKFNIVEEIIFPDHMNYSVNNIESLTKRSKELNAELITTEKDYVKISKIRATNIKFLKIELNLIDEENLISFLKSKIYE